MINQRILGLALVAFLTTGTAQAGSVTLTDFFGAFGSTTEQSTDVNETLSVGLFADTVAGGLGRVLTNVQVEVRGTLSTEGTYINNGPTGAGVSATVLALATPWAATETSGSSLANHEFASAFTNIIDESLGVIGAGEAGSFGVLTNDTGWISLFDGLDGFFDASGSLSYLFSTNTSSFITGGSNFASSFTTGTAGGLRVTYTFEDVVSTNNIPEPAALALMGLVFCVVGYRRRKA